MKTTRRTEIVFERDRTIVYPGRSPHRLAWCESCAGEARMITIFEAAKVLAMSTQAILTRVSNGDIHGAITPEGLLLICPNSLS